MNKNLIIFAIGGAVAAFLLFSRNEEQKQADALLGFTEEIGVIGDLAAATNRASGGVLADIGSATGLFFSKLLNFRAFGEFK